MSSYGQELMSNYLELMIDQPCEVDVRPLWLNGLELDMLWPRLGFAVEFQGDQHFVPSFGLAAHFRQRNNDQIKRQLCLANGITLLRLDAMDLEYTTLYRKLKQAFKDNRHLKCWIRRKSIRYDLRGLNRKAIAYQQTLKESFESMTAYRRGRTRKMARKKAWEGIPLWQIIKARRAAQPRQEIIKPTYVLPIGAGMARARRAGYPIQPCNPRKFQLQAETNHMITSEEIEAIHATLPAEVSLRVSESAVPSRGALCVTIRSPVDAWADWSGPTAADVQAKVNSLVKYLDFPGKTANILPPV